MSEIETLLEIEHALGGGTAEDYDEHLAEESVLVMPGMVLGKRETIEAIGNEPSWDEFTITDERLVEVSDDARVLTYRWNSKRGETSYEALMSSTYARRDGAWKLVFHQQTPLGEAPSG
ncbi:MAG: nuclear transport factor 2 family protein [Actinomycetota bacterium]|nr:nuclear transport factor 2 family protein [Actinomycetota bacterium]